MSFKIYALTEPSGEIRYVGKTIQSLNRRLCSHIKEGLYRTDRTLVRDWIKFLISNNLKPNIILIKEYLFEQPGKWQDMERKWIASFRKQNLHLLNICDGGNGSHKRIELSKEIVNLLGTISDYSLAKLTGRSRSNITYHRNLLNISKYKPKIPYQKFNLSRIAKEPSNKIKMPNFIIPLLGTKSDKKLSILININIKTINRWRNNLKILPYGKRGIQLNERSADWKRNNI